MRIVCDTNVLISGIVFGGLPRQVLEALITGRARGFLSPAMEKDLREVLSRPKFGLSEGHVHQICQSLLDLLHPVFPREDVSVIEEDPDDNLVLACAAEAGADCIVSGNGHLLQLRRYRGIEILTPAELLDRLG